VITPAGRRRGGAIELDDALVVEFPLRGEWAAATTLIPPEPRAPA